MKHSRPDKLPKYYELFQPVLDAIKELGGSAKPTEVRDLLATKLQISDELLEVTKQDGTQFFLDRLQWARLYLSKSGYIGSSKRGVWSLTEKGESADIDEATTKEIVRRVRKLSKPKEDADVVPDDDDETEQVSSDDYRTQVLELLYALSPAAFERMCQRLLRESGFEEVIVTGRSGDGGIDGHGVLQINPFVSFRVLFQCKRYRKTVGSAAIRDFRGAMIGRTDKGIVITTGSFSQDARREAVRDGAPPVELVDGTALVELFESLEFGLQPKQTYEVDPEFFVQFE